MLISFCAYGATFEDQAIKTSYIFVPGLSLSETQLARYLPEFVGITGEKITFSKGIHTIDKDVTTCKFGEIRLKEIKNSFKNPIDLITSFFIDLRNKEFVTEIVKGENETDYTLNGHTVDPSYINLGQGNDISIVKNNYQNHIKKYPNSSIVLYGTSRGAAAAFNFMAQEKPDEIKAVVLEGVFDTINNLLKATCMGFHHIATFFICRFTSYNTNGKSPLQGINNFPKHVPLLLISSKKDQTVPYSCSKNLYKQLKMVGCTNVHLLKLKNPSHGSYACHNDEDRRVYEQVVHAFYKHYNLPFDSVLAQDGQEAWNRILNKK